MRKSTSKYKWTKKCIRFSSYRNFFQRPNIKVQLHIIIDIGIGITESASVPASVVECRATYVSSTTICTRRNDDYDEAGFNAAIQSLVFSVIFWTLWYRHTMARLIYKTYIYILKQKIAFVYLKRGKKNS